MEYRGHILTQDNYGWLYCLTGEEENAMFALSFESAKQLIDEQMENNMENIEEVEAGDIVEYQHETCLLPNKSWHEVISVDHEEKVIFVKNSLDMGDNNHNGSDYYRDSFKIVKKNSFKKKN